MTTFFTADNHFGHLNIIRYCNRPFESAEEMDERMIANWNEAIKHDDLVYHLGDFTLGNKLTARRYFNRLNGQIRVLCNPWHHDKRWLGGEYYSRSGGVEYMKSIVVLEYEPLIILCHYAFANWDRKHHGSWHLHGHSHGEYKAPGKILDVGVDSHSFRPVSLEEVTETMELPERYFVRPYPDFANIEWPKRI